MKLDEVEPMNRARILWIGDACVATGHARITHAVCDVLSREHDVTVLGVSYNNEPHTYPYHIFAAGTDPWGIGRVRELVDRVKPDLVFVLADPWNIPAYTEHITDPNIPVIGIVGVDGYNCRGTMLNSLSHAVFWTKFGRTEALRGGYTGPASVIPLGVDRTIYCPKDRLRVRDEEKVTHVLADFGCPRDSFIVGVVAKNQVRKRLDLTIRYFAKWIQSENIRDAFLWLHLLPTHDNAYDVMQLAQYYGVADRLFAPNYDRFGTTDQHLARIYSMCDIGLTTTQGEGFGLTVFEMMACRIPVIVPAWSALQELTYDAALQVPCYETAATLNCINTIGGIPDGQETITKLNRLYRNRDEREKWAEAGYALASEPRFSWPVIAQQYMDLVSRAMRVHGRQLQPAMAVTNVTDAGATSR